MQIRVLGVPQSGAKSRVETQIKLCIQLVTDEGDKAQWWSHLKLPEHMVAKDKLKRQLTQNGKIAIDPIKNEKMLYLSARVICASDPTRKVVTCLGCIQRERKRSQRRKENKMKLEGEEEEEKSVSLEEQKVLLFNCSEIVDFSSGDTILPTRITCYCRHHNERLGFCIYFEMQDHTGKQVATGMSPPIMITDDHKSNKIKTTRKRLRTEDKSSFDMRKAGSPSNRINYHPHPYQIQPQPDNIRSPLDSPVFTEKPVDRPLLQRLIPNEGPTYGGIEVTLLGSGFRSGLTCMFGDVAASSTHYWSPNTLVCILPPATEAGTVVVSFKEHPLMVDNQEVTLFTYYNENDRALMELALQVVGLKMTGKVEDARDIAMRIVQGGNGQESKQLSNNNNNGNTNQLSLEQHIIQVLNIMSTFHDVESTDVSIKNPQGHTMLHLAAMLGFDELMERLIRLGCQVNRTDRNGYTALHYAVSYRHEKVIQVLLNGHADLDIVNRWNQKPFDTDLWETSTESSIEDAIQYLNEEENTSHSADEILDAELVEEKTWMQRTLSHFQPPPTDLKQLSDQFPFFSSNKVKEPTLAWYMALAYAMGAGLDKENPPPVEVKRKDRRLYSFWVPMLCCKCVCVSVSISL
ncbi:hypothetical protein BDB01DRAFT_727193 [Pilobolus umbonatus]|nr:hypothetical protein BDB01DRAFT_727193 [Pilobolus umbonatus]